MKLIQYLNGAGGPSEQWPFGIYVLGAGAPPPPAARPAGGGVLGGWWGF